MSAQINTRYKPGQVRANYTKIPVDHHGQVPDVGPQC